MGSFVSIPVDVFKNCVLPLLPDYLDRVHLAMTCKTFLAQMKERDELTCLILTKQYCKVLYWIAEMNHYHSFTRLRLLMCYINCDYKGFLPTTNMMILMEMRRSVDIKYFFDRDALIHLYGVFGKKIPKCYFSILTSNAGRCAAFASVGCYSLFVKYSNPELLKEDVESYDKFEQFGKMVSYEAGLGGNTEICREMLIEWKSFSTHVVAGLKKNNHMEILCALSKEFPSLNKKQKY